MSARAKSKIVFRIATSSARAASWALRSPSAFASDCAWRPSATFCSAARACSTASAYSPRSKCPSALSSNATASSRLMPASWPSWIFRSARLMRFLEAATSSSISSFAVPSRLVRIVSTSSKFRFSSARSAARRPSSAPAMSMSAFRRSSMSFLTMMNFVAAQRAFVRVSRLTLQRDLDAVDDPFRGGDHVLRLAQPSPLDCLFRGRQDLHGLLEVGVVRDEVRDFRADGLHPSMDSLRALLLRSDVLFLGLPLRVVRGPLEFLDLGDARLADVQRVAVPRFRVRRLGVLEHPGRRIDRHAVGFRERDAAARFAEHLRRGAPQQLSCRVDVVLDPVELRVGLEEPVFLDRDRDVRELALERHGVVLAGLPQSDDVVPGPEHVLVQAGLRLGVGVRHPIIDDRLHVDLPTERDRIVDLA